MGGATGVAAAMGAGFSGCGAFSGAGAEVVGLGLAGMAVGARDAPPSGTPAVRFGGLGGEGLGIGDVGVGFYGLGFSV